jgi:LysR family glycine cleavage system transcriptional activator
MRSGSQRRLPPLRALQAFEAAARLGSVTRAAAELGVTPSAISHQIAQLEDHVGVPLFHRTGRRVAVNDAGWAYLQQIESVFDRVEEATRRVLGSAGADVLTIHCQPSFAPAWLLPRLPDFLARHPRIDLRIRASPGHPDFAALEADAEIRFGTGEWPGLDALLVAADQVTPLIAPGLAARLEPAFGPAALLGLPLIHSERQVIGWVDWAASQGITLRAAQLRGLRVDRGYLAIQAAAAGLGVALESTVFAERELKSGGLLAPLLPAAGGPVPRFGHYLVHPVAHAAFPKLAAFRRWLVEARDGEGPRPPCA